MNKRFTGLATALALTLTAGSAAAQEALCNNAAGMDADILEVYDAFQHDAETGSWSLTPNSAEAVLDAVSNDYVRSDTGSGTVFFYTSLEGNSFDNIVLPYINIYFIGSAEIKAGAASLIVNGTRYDFETTCARHDINGYRAELMRAPLNSDGKAMLRALGSADEFGIVLHGEKHVYKARVNTAIKPYNAHDEIQAASVKSALEGLTICDMLGSADNSGIIARWEAETGLDCAFVPTDHEPAEADADDSFGILSIGERSTDVAALQKLLKKAGYMYAKAPMRFNAQTRAAVLRAQREFGMVPTGSADRQLMDMLQAKSEGSLNAPPIRSDAAGLTAKAPATVIVSSDTPTDADAGRVYEIPNMAELAINSYRFAARITPRAGDEAFAINASSRGNKFIIFEGDLKSLAPKELDIAFNEYSAVVTMDDGLHQYKGSITCESADGSSFTTNILPLGGGRLIVYAEVPAELENYRGEWTLYIVIGNTALNYKAIA